MNCKKIILILLSIACWHVVGAQDMPRTVIGNAGDYYQHIQVGNLHWTVGEIAVSRYQNGLELNEGFHQMYYDLLVATDEQLPPEWDVSVYPNPTTDWVRLRFPEEQTLTAELFAGDGQKLLDLADLHGMAVLDFGSYPEGTYLLRLRDDAGRQRTVKVLKMRL